MKAIVDPEILGPMSSPVVRLETPRECVAILPALMEVLMCEFAQSGDPAMSDRVGEFENQLLDVATHPNLPDCMEFDLTIDEAEVGAQQTDQIGDNEVYRIIVGRTGRQEIAQQLTMCLGQIWSQALSIEYTNA